MNKTMSALQKIVSIVDKNKEMKKSDKNFILNIIMSFMSFIEDEAK